MSETTSYRAKPAPRETELLRAARSGDDAAWPPLMERYEPRVRAVLAGLLGNPVRVEEATQDAFVTAWLELPKLRDDRAFGAWVVQIARNVARDRFRAAKKSPRSLDADYEEYGSEPADPQTDPIEMQRVELMRDVLVLLDELPEPYASLLTARFFDGESCKQIAERTERPLHTITKQLSRAYALVADFLIRRGGHTTTLLNWMPGRMQDPRDVVAEGGAMAGGEVARG